MQIVIDIPDDVYIDVLEVNGSYGFDFIRAIKDGMILPKGHGRLIDADETLKRHCNEMCKYKMGCEEDCFVYDTFHLASTIIEADKEIENADKEVSDGNS